MLTLSSLEGGAVPLEEYRRKRDRQRTPEPIPAADPASPADGHGELFVIQQHHARSLHWDLRLERDGVLASWAVPKGLPEDPGTIRLAVRTEDHPMEYADFSGEIPAGEYGAGRRTGCCAGATRRTTPTTGRSPASSPPCWPPQECCPNRTRPGATRCDSVAPGCSRGWTAAGWSCSGRTASRCPTGTLSWPDWAPPWARPPCCWTGKSAVLPRACGSMICCTWTAGTPWSCPIATGGRWPR